MKNYAYLIAALLVLPVFFSCGGKQNPEKPDNGSGKETPVNPTPSTPTTPDTPSTPSVPEPEPPIEFRRTVRFGHSILSMNGSKDYIAVYDEAIVTKSGDTRKIITGSFTFDDKQKTYSLTGFGTLEIIDEKKVAFTPSGGSRKEYDAETSLIVVDETTAAYLINRTWTINESILKFRGVNYSFDGLDLNEVERIARDQGIEFKYHMNEGMVAKKLIITDALMAAEFKNGESYSAEHNLRSGTSFDLSEFTNGIKGTATVQLDKEDPEWCYITIQTTLDESPAEVLFTLKELK